MSKLQSFFTLKFSSARLKDCNYKIDSLSLDQARQNGEAVRLADSELLRAVRMIRGINFNQSELDDLLRQKKKRKNSFGLSEKIDKLLYVDDIITVEFDDARHYKNVIDRGGISINGKIYQRLLTGAGMARRSTVMFCNTEIIEPLREILHCDRNPEYKIAPSKFNAYFALASSSTWRVPRPNFVVIPDCEVERITRVDFLHETEDKTRDPLVYPEDKLLKFNLFDGQGLISPRMSEVWKNTLDLDYLPSAWVFRGAFLKGLLVTFDFHDFAHSHNIYKIKDIYGDEYDIDTIDAIVSVSQFKLWGAYKNIEDYNAKCDKHDYMWGVSKYSPKKDKDFAFSTYQYVQNLNIVNKEQIEGLCKKTVEWFKNVTGEDWIYTVLFLMGDIDKSRIGSEWFDNLDNPLLQVLLLEPKLINDKQIQNKVQRLISKKIKESYLGVLLIDGHYSFMIADPYAQAQWAFGLGHEGLLSKGQHYSQYWNKRKKDKVSAIRSPMTFCSENNVLDLQDSKELDYWYKYINSGIIFNVHGTDMMRMSGADNDGDLCLTTSQPEFISCAHTDFLPPAYERKTAEKKIIVEDELWEYDIKTFKSRIGLITNIGTECFALLPLFEKDSPEYNEILNRLKICNCFQSMEIDRAKGIQTMDIPRYWTKWDRIGESESEESAYIKELHHKTICDKRPYFFRYLYPEYDKKYKERIETYDNYCESKFDGNLKYTIDKQNKSDAESKAIDNFYRFGDLLHSDCIMNNICNYMESNVSQIKKNNKLKSFDFESIIADNDFNHKNNVIIENIYQKYRQYKISINYHTNSSGFQEMMQWLRNQADCIIASSDEIVHWASQFGSSFLLDVFSHDLIDVLKRYSGGNIMMPVISHDGYIEYMGSKYEIRKIEV